MARSKLHVYHLKELLRFYSLIIICRSLPVADIFVTSVPGIEVDVDNQMKYVYIYIVASTL